MDEIDRTEKTNDKLEKENEMLQVYENNLYVGTDIEIPTMFRKRVERTIELIYQNWVVGIGRERQRGNHLTTSDKRGTDVAFPLERLSH